MHVKYLLFTVLDFFFFTQVTIFLLAPNFPASDNSTEWVWNFTSREIAAPVNMKM